MASFGEEQLSGLAGEIRRSIESDQYDLANYTETRVKDLVTAAFSSPLTGPTTMIRCTFVAGGGKLVRAKYADDLPKWMLSALRDIGFTEDRSAAETFDSQGTYKQQHDTGQNLKYVIVYPRVACASQAAASSSSSSTAATSDLPDTSTPEWTAASAGLDVFKQMVKGKVESWRAKKKLLKILQDATETFQAIETKLCSGQALTPREQALYEGNSGADADKVTWLQGEIKEMGENGRLTASEQKELVESISANLKSLEADKDKAEAEGKPKAAEKIAEKMVMVTARRAKIAEAVPITPRLRHGDEIQKLRVKLLTLQALEDRPKSQPLTIADLQTLSEKPDVEQAVEELEKASRGWFEADEDFSARCAHEAKEALAKYKARLKVASSAKKSSGGASLGSKGKTGTQKIGGGGSSYSTSTASWATIGVKKPVSGGGGGGGKGGGGGSKAGGFAAAFGGDDSDEDD